MPATTGPAEFVRARIAFNQAQNLPQAEKRGRLLSLTQEWTEQATTEGVDIASAIGLTVWAVRALVEIERSNVDPVDAGMAVLAQRGMVKLP